MENKPWELTDSNFVSGTDHERFLQAAHTAQKKLLEYLNERYSDVDYFVAIPSLEWRNLLKEFGIGDNNV